MKRGTVCTYCKRRLQQKGSHSALAATRDHVVPKSQGGYRTVWACFACNGLKGNLSPERMGALHAR